MSQSLIHGCMLGLVIGTLRGVGGRGGVGDYTSLNKPY